MDEGDEKPDITKKSSTPEDERKAAIRAKRQEWAATTLAPYKWQKGQSGNPGGRRKGVAERAREQLEKDDGDIFEWLNDVRLGKIGPFGAREKLEAAKMLMDRGYGRAPETHVNIDATDSMSALGDVSADQIRDLMNQITDAKSDDKDSTKDGSDLDPAH